MFKKNFSAIATSPPSAKLDQQNQHQQNHQTRIPRPNLPSVDSVDNLPLPPTPTVNQEYKYEAISDIVSRNTNNATKTTRTPRTSTSSSTISNNNPIAKRSQSQPPKSLPPMMSNGNNTSVNGNGGIHGNGGINGAINGVGITSPPNIDRHSKPSRISRDGGFHTYNAHRNHQHYHNHAVDGSLDRRTHVRDMKMVNTLMYILNYSRILLSLNF